MTRRGLPTRGVACDSGHVGVANDAPEFDQRRISIQPMAAEHYLERALRALVGVLGAPHVEGVPVQGGRVCIRLDEMNSA